MNASERAFLWRIRGEVDALFQLPTLQTMADDRLVIVEAWQGAYSKEGALFSRSHDDAEVLRTLAADDWLCTSGKTKATTHKLTLRAICTTTAGETAATLRDFLEGVSELQDASAVRYPCGGGKILLGCDLLTIGETFDCGPFWEKAMASPATWKIYLDSLRRLEIPLHALAAVGFVTILVSSNAAFWAVTVTPSGRAMLADGATWPEVKPLPEAFDSWRAGFEAGLTRWANTTPPPWTKSSCATRLPCSRWY